MSFVISPDTADHQVLDPLFFEPSLREQRNDTYNSLATAYNNLQCGTIMRIPLAAVGGRQALLRALTRRGLTLHVDYGCRTDTASQVCFIKKLSTTVATMVRLK